MHRRLFLSLSTAALAQAAVAQAALAQSAMAQGAPLRVGIGVGQVGSAFWAVPGPRGVTVELARALPQAWGRQLELVAYNASGEVTEAVARGEVEVAFMPTDPARAAQVAFGPDFYLFTSTLLLMPGVGDTPARIVGVRNTTTIRAAERAYPAATFTATTGMADAIAALREGRADAVALGRESLNALLPELPGARILAGHFHASGTAIAVPPGRPEALAAATAWMEQAKADGTVLAALRAHGIMGPVAPPGSRTGAPG